MAVQYPDCKITKAVGRPCADRQGGISKLYLFSYVKYSKSLNLVQDQEVITFPSTVAYEWQAQNISFTESTSVKNGGVEWTQKLSFIVTDSNVSSEVYKLPNKDYSAVILDRNGNYRFIGMRNGAEVTVNASSGTGKSDLNGYNISLTAKEDNQAYYIPTLTFESLFNVVEPIVFELPSRATNLRLNGPYTGGSATSVKWDASTQGTLPIDGYYLYVNNLFYKDVSFSTVSTIFDLEPGFDNEVYVKAYDTKGNLGGASNELILTTVSGDFAVRVANDFGYTESLECINI